jgi:hypothetical protein
MNNRRIKENLESAKAGIDMALTAINKIELQIKEGLLLDRYNTKTNDNGELNKKINDYEMEKL